jgi:hypothetical protein
MNGNYSVTEATHRIDSGGYNLNIKAVAQGIIKSFMSKNMTAKQNTAEDPNKIKDSGGTTKEAK